MNRGVNVVAQEVLGDKNGVFEVVSVPRHVCDENVLSDGEFALICRRAVCDYVARFDLLALLYDGHLVKTGSGV